jgi:hypothetical protein
MSNITTTVSESSGFTRVTYGGANLDELAQANANYEPNRVVGGVIKAVGGQVQDSAGSASYSAFHDTPKNPASVMATLQRDARGQSVELEPGNPASRTTLETAIRGGLVQEVSRGVYMDAQTLQAQPAPQQAPTQALEKQEAPQDEPFAFVDANDRALWNEDVAPLEQHVYDSAVASTVAFVATGKGSLETIAKRLASEGGLEPELAQEYVNTGVAHYKNSLSRDLIAAVGLPKGQVEQFYNWTRTQPALSKALSEMMHQGTTREFRELALAFKREATGKADVSPFKAAGMQTMLDRASGDLLVRMPGKNWVKARDL